MCLIFVWYSSTESKVTPVKPMRGSVTHKSDCIITAVLINNSPQLITVRQAVPCLGVIADNDLSACVLSH